MSFENRASAHRSSSENGTRPIFPVYLRARSRSPRNLPHVFTISLVGERYLILLSKLIPARWAGACCYPKVRIAARVGARMVLVAHWNTSEEREARWKLPSIFLGLSLTIRILLRGRERVVAS